MTYRDDHDAAIARAEALQADLERSEAERARAEAERDRLRAKVDQLEHSPGALVGPTQTALTNAEVDTLLVQVETAAARQQPVDKRIAIGFVVGTGVLTIAGAATSLEMFELGGFAFVVAIVLSLVSGAGASNKPQEVAKALREAPETITGLRVTQNGVVVETSTDTVEVPTSAPGDLERRLSLRCPNAKLT